jgi:hypothetical protein
LTTAGSVLGFKHSEASLELIRAAALKRKPKTLSEETKSKISAAITGKKHSDETKEKMRGRKHTEATRAKIGANNYQIQPAVVTNIKTGVSVEFSSMKKVADYLNVSVSHVSKYVKIHKPIRALDSSYKVTKK